MAPEPPGADESPPERPPELVDPAAYQERVDRITDLFSSMISTADELSQRRCPYKNRFDECTANFGCRNQRFPDGKDGRMLCGADDADLNYRSAWELDQELDSQ